MIRSHWEAVENKNGEMYLALDVRTFQLVFSGIRIVVNGFIFAI
jgi:hypothetical protein